MKKDLRKAIEDGDFYGKWECGATGRKLMSVRTGRAAGPR